MGPIKEAYFLVPNDGLRSVKAQARLPARAVHGAVGHQGARLVVDRCFERRPKNDEIKII